MLSGLVTRTMRGLISNDGAEGAYLLTLAEARPAIVDVLKALPGMRTVQPPSDGVAEYAVTFDKEQLTPNGILAAALGAGVPIVSFAEDVKHLNEAFMDLTEPGVRQ